MKDKLIRLGLTEREADAYIALSNFKETTATELAKITKEHRTNIYDSLNELIKKGLITYAIRNNIKFYKLANPDRLVDFIKEKETIAKTILPELRNKLSSTEDKPFVEVYEGPEGFKSILSLILRVKKTIYAIGAAEEWYKRFPIHIEQYMRDRKIKDIHAKLLYVKGTKPIKSPLNKIKFLPTEFAHPSTIAIFGDYVVTFMWTDPLVATLTKSKQLANSFIKYFDVLWKIAKK